MAWGQTIMNKSRKKKVRQTAYDKLTFAEIQHLRRRGLNITKSSPKRPTKRPLRRLVAWWNTTPIEKFFEDIVFFTPKCRFVRYYQLSCRCHNNC